ncbi:cupin domain-containing protein [Ancylobacter polymorphus]|uniref:Cupin superfamily protein n=1 Tax=Ancylobacter polymorphus TaxID=223390 RepID=A0ABU0B9P5_9HYPH|nr:cupin domain-containing protein [Ancylobacter polymorphus]MDQ0302553.1 putative cupin superfamily protein [Ancylobacter polymorphus]
MLIRNRGLEKVIITPPAASRLKAFLVSLDPGASSGDEPYSHNGQEVGYVVSGSMELEIGDKSYVLNAGDCVAFDSDIAHRFWSRGSKSASILWVNAPTSS